MLHPKKVSSIKIKGCDDEKQTNEIKTASPLLSVLDIKGRTITADALLTQRELARHLVEDHHAHYHFTVKGNQKNLLNDLALYFQNLTTDADFTQTEQGEHGRIEIRKIWTTTTLNDYLDFPYVSQAFKIERVSINKKTGKQSQEVAYGITSLSQAQASPEDILKDNRGHWRIESIHYIIDWNFDEDRSQIRTGFGPENITRLRRFAIGLLKARQKKETIAAMMKKLLFNTRAVFDYLKLTRNSNILSTG